MSSSDETDAYFPSISLDDEETGQQENTEEDNEEYNEKDDDNYLSMFRWQLSKYVDIAKITGEYQVLKAPEVELKKEALDQVNEHVSDYSEQVFDWDYLMQRCRWRLPVPSSWYPDKENKIQFEIASKVYNEKLETRPDLEGSQSPAGERLDELTRNMHKNIKIRYNPPPPKVNEKGEKKCAEPFDCQIKAWPAARDLAMYFDGHCIPTKDGINQLKEFNNNSKAYFGTRDRKQIYEKKEKVTRFDTRNLISFFISFCVVMIGIFFFTSFYTRTFLITPHGCSVIEDVNTQLPLPVAGYYAGTRYGTNLMTAQVWYNQPWELRPYQGLCPMGAQTEESWGSLAKRAAIASMTNTYTPNPNGGRPACIRRNTEGSPEVFAIMDSINKVDEPSKDSDFSNSWARYKSYVLWARGGFITICIFSFGLVPAGLIMASLTMGGKNIVNSGEFEVPDEGANDLTNKLYTKEDEYIRVTRPTTYGTKNICLAGALLLLIIPYLVNPAKMYALLQNSSFANEDYYKPMFPHCTGVVVETKDGFTTATAAYAFGLMAFLSYIGVLFILPGFFPKSFERTQLAVINAEMEIAVPGTRDFWEYREVMKYQALLLKFRCMEMKTMDLLMPKTGPILDERRKQWLCAINLIWSENVKDLCTGLRVYRKGFTHPFLEEHLDEVNKWDGLALVQAAITLLRHKYVPEKSKEKLYEELMETLNSERFKAGGLKEHQPDIPLPDPSNWYRAQSKHTVVPEDVIKNFKGPHMFHHDKYSSLHTATASPTRTATATATAAAATVSATVSATVPDTKTQNPISSSSPLLTAAVKSLPPGWVRKDKVNGMPYWYNTNTGESTETNPDGSGETSTNPNIPPPRDIGGGWTEKTNLNMKKYYVNSETGAVSETFPLEVDSDSVD